jgi:hypothetical protein
MTDLYQESYPAAIYTPGPEPEVTTLSPASIVVNAPTQVTVTGTGFGQGSRVVVDGVPQQAQWVSTTTMRYTAQGDMVGTQDVRVVTRFGQIADPPGVLTLVAAGTQEAQSLTAEQEALAMLPAGVAGHTIPAVQAWVEANPDRADEVLAAEAERDQPRVTLVAWLDAFLHPETVETPETTEPEEAE